MHSRKKHMKTLMHRYNQTKSRKEKSILINEVMSITELDQKYVLEQ